MSAPPFAILYEDNHLLAVVKPAGIATMGVRSGKPSVLELARQYIKRRYHKPGKVYLGIVSRLDAPVTGVLLMARTSKAAARLTEQFRSRAVEKTYWAAVEGTVEPAQGELFDRLVSHERRRKMEVALPGAAGAKEARLTYRVLGRWREGSWLEVTLGTGRKHQIRAQFARRGHPIAGDRKYGARTALPSGIALHARRLVVDHPVRHEPVVLVAPLPAAWRGLRISNGSARESGPPSA